MTVLTPTIPQRLGMLMEAADSVRAQTVPTAHSVLHDFDGLGPALIRNELLAACDTEWVVFLDDDDLLDPDFVERTLAAQFSTHADVIIPRCRFSGRTIPAQFCNRPYDREALRQHGIFPITTLVRKTALEAVGGFDVTARWEDWTAWNAMADTGSTFFNLPGGPAWTYRRGLWPNRTDGTLA